MSKSVRRIDAEQIRVGNTVQTRLRGGKREGEVEAIINSEEDLKQSGDLGVNIKNPPKVVFTDQHGHTVSHNPDTLSHGEDK